MKIYFRVLILSQFLVSVFSSYGTEQIRYKIVGITKGFQDSTLLFLDDVATSETIDSTFIINNQFQFEGSLKEKNLHVIISTEDHSNYKFFWLENSNITFNAESGKFRNALITGSKTQNDDDLLFVKINPIKDARDSISKKYYADTSTASRKLLESAFDVLDKKETEEYQSFVKNHSASIVSAYVLNIYATTWGRDMVQLLFRNFTAENKNTSYGKEIDDFLKLNKNLKIGDNYVDFTQQNNLGQNVSLSDFKNKIVLLEFWASWCYGCAESNPKLVKLYQEFKAQGFEVLAVSLDRDKQAWLNCINKDGLIWTNVSELNGNRNKAALIYGVNSIPDNFLISSNGTIVARNLDPTSLKDKLTELLR